MFNNNLPKPITCPHCRSKELAFVTEYHKAIGTRIAFIFIMGIALFCLFSTFGDNKIFGGIIYAVIFGLIAFIVYICVLLEESKTHVQGICKNCGHLWLLN